MRHSNGVVRLVHVSDVHAAMDRGRLVYGESSDDNLASALAASLRRGGRPDVVIATGDIADDASPAAYTRVAAVLRDFAPTALWVPGNHDDPDRMLELEPGSFPAAVRLGAWELLLLDTSWTSHDEGRVGEAQLAWIGERLATSPCYVAVILHHPPIPACTDPGCQLSDADALLDILGRWPDVRLVLSGHNHRPFEHRLGAIDFLGAPSTCRRAHHEPPRHAWTNEGPAARSIVLLPDGTTENHVVWIDDPPAERELTWFD